MFGPRRLLVLVLALSLPLAGCLKKPEDATPDAGPLVNETPEQNATLPDGRGESAGLLETNKTEEGVGGVEHRHDYWQNKEQIVLLDRTVFVGCPCFPDGEGSQPKAVGYTKLEKLPDGSADALVYEGADRVEVLFGAPLVTSGGSIIDGQGVAIPAAPHPSPPALFFQFRSASDSEWREAVPVTYGSPLVIEVATEMTDMPHSVHSLWVFRLTTDRAEGNMEVPMTVTVYKGRDVVDWPGHPDFYAEKHERVVMQQHVTTHMSGFQEGTLYDGGGTWAYPERLISWGTKAIRVFVNVTSTTNEVGATPTGYFLEAINATVIGPEVTFGSRHHDVHESNDLTHYEYAILVDEIGMDGPYQPGSRWGFRQMATFADVEGVVGFCPGCFPYDIEYDITVIAMDAAPEDAEAMEEPV